MLKSSLPQILS